MPDAANRAGLYLRVSTEKQVEGYSLAAQRRLLTNLATGRGWTVVEEYMDAGISGATMAARPAFLRMLADASESKFDYVLTVDLDRISRSRDLKTWAEVLERLRAGNARIVTLSQEIDPEKPEDIFLAHIFGAVAALEKSKIAQRTRRGSEEAVRRGQRLGGVPPFGYLYDRNLRKLVPNPDEAPAVPLLFDLYLSGHTQAGVARELDRRGYRTRSGKAWRPHVVRQILRSPVYTGFTVWNRSNQSRTRWRSRDRSEWVWSEERSHEALISMDLWERTQTAMRRRGCSVTQPTYEESPFLLTGFVFCHCGQRMAGHKTTRRNEDGSVRSAYRRYMCQGYLKNLPRHPAVNAEYLEEEVIDRIAGLTTSPAVLERARKELILDRMRTNTTAAKDLDSLRAELESLRTKQSVLYEDRLEGRVTTDQWTRFNNNFLSRDEALSARIAAEEANLLSSNGGPADVTAVLEVLRDFRRTFGELENLQKKLVLREIVGAVRVQGKQTGPDVQLRSPWSQILRLGESKDRNSLPARAIR